MLLAIGVALILSLVSIEIGLVLSVLSAIPLGFAASRSFRRP